VFGKYIRTHDDNKHTALYALNNLFGVRYFVIDTTTSAPKPTVYQPLIKLQDKKSIKSSSRLFFDNGIVFVVKNERN
jgi:hypothetical protein